MILRWQWQYHHSQSIILDFTKRCFEAIFELLGALLIQEVRVCLQKDLDSLRRQRILPKERSQFGYGFGSLQFPVKNSHSWATSRDTILVVLGGTLLLLSLLGEPLPELCGPELLEQALGGLGVLVGDVEHLWRLQTWHFEFHCWNHQRTLRLYFDFNVRSRVTKLPPVAKYCSLALTSSQVLVILGRLGTLTQTVSRFTTLPCLTVELVWKMIVSTHMRSS